jgi:sulfonate transport system substrate-binding protein
MSSTAVSAPRRRAVLAALAATSVAVLAACGSGSSGASTAASSAAPAASSAGSTDLSGVTIRVGQTLWPQQKTIFELAGLDKTPYTIEWSIFPGGDKQLQALGAGALDVAATSDIPPIFAVAGNNTAFKVVAIQQGSTLLQEVLAGKDSGITSIAGLKGKKVAFVPSTTAQYFLAKLLDSAGLKFSDIEAVPLAPADGATALASGKVDALASYGPSLALLRAQGAVQIGSGKDILSGNFPVEVATSALDDPKKKAAVVDYLTRLDKAQAFARDHAADYVAKQITFTKQTQADALAVFTEGEAQRPTKIVPVSPEAIAKQQDVADTFVTLGVLKAKVDVASYFSDVLSADLSGLASS